MENIHVWGKRAAKPHIFFYTLIWLIVILVLGTVQQKFIGLYEAQRIYFSAFIFWIGAFPVPAGYSALTIMFINLLCKLVFVSPWSWKRSGTIIAHFGSLLLLFGGLLTAVNSQEGSMYINEGETSQTVEDYYARELVVFERDSAGQKKIIAQLDQKHLKDGAVLPVTGTRLNFEILKSCRNCDVFARTAPSSETLRGRAEAFDFRTIALDPQAENNRSGVAFKVSGADDQQNGVYLSFDFVDEAPSISLGERIFYIKLRKAETILPFSIEVIDFQKEMYPGTDMARSYRSHIIVHEGNRQWPSIIQMNQPLRYKGYTFYQSSFAESEQGEATVLAVVHNAGRLFPYISSIIMCIGLLIHICLQIPRLFKGKKS